MRVPRSGSRNHPDHALPIPADTTFPPHNPPGEWREIRDVSEAPDGYVVLESEGRLYAVTPGTQAITELKRRLGVGKYQQVHQSTKE